MNEQQFIEHLDKYPDDWTTRLVYADWLEDNSDPYFAVAQRWLVVNKRYPNRSEVEGKVYWRWYSEQYKPNGTYTIPGFIWDEFIKRYGMNRKPGEEILAWHLSCTNSYISRNFLERLLTGLVWKDM